MFYPTLGNVLAIRIEEDSEIILADGSKGIIVGKVKSVGPGTADKPMAIKEGDMIHFFERSAQSITLNRSFYYVVPQEDVLAYETPEA